MHQLNCPFGHHIKSVLKKEAQTQARQSPYLRQIDMGDQTSKRYAIINQDEETQAVYMKYYVLGKRLPEIDEFMIRFNATEEREIHQGTCLEDAMSLIPIFGEKKRGRGSFEKRRFILSS